MHELALCDAMLKMVRDISREQALEGVRSITVRVGSLSGVVPRFLTDCWVAVTDGTEYDGVPLRVETEAGRARCLDCGAEFVADVEDLSCPDCGGKKLMPLSGRDMTIQEIEAVLTPYAAGPRHPRGLFGPQNAPGKQIASGGILHAQIEIRSPRCRPCAGAAPHRGCCSRRSGT